MAATLCSLLVSAGIAIFGAVDAHAQSSPAPNPLDGKAIFARCSTCHSADPGVTKIGPSLADVVNRQAGSIADYSYSPAMKSAGLIWTPSNLDKFLTAPRTVVPGTKMGFPGLSSASDRDNVIAYLQSISKTKPPVGKSKPKPKPARH
jgi:cytochrome c2